MSCQLAPPRRLLSAAPLLVLVAAALGALLLGAAVSAQAVDCPDDETSKCQCESLFAYRVLELAREAGGTPRNCDARLGVAVHWCPDGLSLDACRNLRHGVAQLAEPLCRADLSANACRDRRYRDPPSLPEPPRMPSGLARKLEEKGAVRGSHRAKYLPRCADASDTCQTDEVVCQDGTRPRVYIDKAVDEQGADMQSNGWIIFLGGEGDPCSDERAHSVRTGLCWAHYEVGGARNRNYQLAMSTMHPDFPPGPITRELGGIMDDAAFVGGAPNNFRHFNRIKFDRCTDWASDAEEMTTVVPITGAWESRTVTDKVNVWHRGLNTVTSLFHMLTTSAGQDIDEDGVIDLPSLAAATHVVLAASSDSTRWLVSAADELRARLRAITPTAEVKLVLDGYFPPRLENEARYNRNPGRVFGNPKGELLPEDEARVAGRSYSEAHYVTGGDVRQKWDARATLLDASCVAAHALEKCYEEGHVLLHHLDTDFLILASQQDDTLMGLSLFADDPAYSWQEVEFRKRVRDQAEDIELRWAARSEDPASPGRSYILPYDSVHVRLADSEELGKKMTFCTDDGRGGWVQDTRSIAEMIHRWLIFGTEVFAVEDPRGADSAGLGPHWVTEQDAKCGQPRRDDGAPLP